MCEAVSSSLEHSVQTHASVLGNKGILRVGWQMESSQHISHNAEKRRRGGGGVVGWDTPNSHWKTQRNITKLTEDNENAKLEKHTVFSS